MASSEESLLNSLGLTFSQVKVYLSLVYNGPSKVSQISKASGIHRAHLYQILHSLECNGLVERNLANGIFMSTSLKDTLKMLIEQKHQEIVEMEATAKTIMGTPKSEPKIQKAPEIFLLTNKIQILKKAGSYPENARKTICLMHSWNRFLQLWQNYSVIFSNAMARGVTVKQIIECPADKTNIQSFLSNPVFSNRLFEGRFISRNGGNFSIVDDEMMMVSTSTEKAVLGEAPMLFSNYTGLLEVMKNYFFETWKNAHNWTELQQVKK
jgi:sugar-specific transcriptional regulator TrmB